jgi:acetylornithine deacetylase/succinyl-diaminopimelate desuccinylase-like protein
MLSPSQEVITYDAAAEGPADLDVTLLFNGDEESGSPSSRSVIEEVAAGQDVALVFEAARESGAIVSSRRGVARYRLDVTGRAAHSGSNPDAGANALETLAHRIIDVQEIYPHDKKLEIPNVFRTEDEAHPGVKGVVEKRNTMPILSNILLEAKADGVDILAAPDVPPIALVGRGVHFLLVVRLCLINL